jgi:hypothetical protein
VKSLRPFRIYIRGYYHIEISRDVTFDEDATLTISRKCHLEEVYEEEHVAPRVVEPVKEVTVSPHDEISEDHDMIESQEPHQMMISHSEEKDASLGKGTYSIWREALYGAPEGIIINN